MPRTKPIFKIYTQELPNLELYDPALMNQSSKIPPPDQTPPDRSSSQNVADQDAAAEAVELMHEPDQKNDRKKQEQSTQSALPKKQQSGKSAKAKKVKKIKVVPNILETRGNDTLYGSSGHDIFVYRPGDGLLRIEDTAGVNILVLKQIHREQIRVNIRPDGFLVVTYLKKAIVEMRGIDYIQTDEGVFPVEDWIVM